jgi:hypothetical protein
MCAACVAQGAAYVGGATVVLRGLAFRARRRSRSAAATSPPRPSHHDEVADEVLAPR